MPRPRYYPVVDLKNPEARGRCDRGGEIRPLSQLRKEYIWAGNELVWNHHLVCDKHRDPPHPQDKPLVLKPDPVPVENPRPDIDVHKVRSALEYPDGSFMRTPDDKMILSSDLLKPAPHQDVPQPPPQPSGWIQE